MINLTKQQMKQNRTEQDEEAKKAEEIRKRSLETLKGGAKRNADDSQHGARQKKK